MKFRAENLGKTYQRRAVVKNVSLDVASGEIVGLLGPNGAGKTTTFYMLAGLIYPDVGDVYLHDMRITAFPLHKRARKGIGYLPQEASVFRNLTVEENIMTVLEMTPLSKSARRERVEGLLEAFDLTTIRHQQGRILSGGERRRTEIARALAIDPKFLLLDEPFSGVDPMAITELQKLMIRLKGQGVGVLITDHNARATLAITDRAYLMFEGGLLQSGTPAELMADERVRSLYLGDSFSL